MIALANYANESYRKVQKFSTEQAYRHGVDKVYNYGPEDIDEEFKQKYQDILSAKRGNGYWLWKPYIVKKALKELNEGDFLIYADSASAIVSNIKRLIKTLEKSNLDVMPFLFTTVEKEWTKRDAFILMGCDSPPYTDSNQIEATFIVLKKSEFSKRIIDEWLQFCCDRRIVTDEDNVMGKENYPGFRGNRHDQTVWSLVCKRNGLPVFRNPESFIKNDRALPKSVQRRSTYGQVMEGHIKSDCSDVKQLNYRWYKTIWHTIKSFLMPIKNYMTIGKNYRFLQEPWISKKDK